LGDGHPAAPANVFSRVARGRVPSGRRAPHEKTYAIKRTWYERGGPMPNEYVDRILRESGLDNLLEVLAERLAPTDLQSLLLEVYWRRVCAVFERNVV
jgi:hypothetical protein